MTSQVRIHSSCLPLIDAGGGVLQRDVCSCTSRWSKVVYRWLTASHGGRERYVASNDRRTDYRERCVNGACCKDGNYR